MTFRVFVVASLCLVPVAARASGNQNALSEDKPSAPAQSTQHTHDHKNLYTCSMHPQVVSEEPGICPICSMDLVPLVVGPAKSSEKGEAASELVLDPSVVQKIGVRTAKVERGDVVRRVRTIGEVEVAESEESVVNLRFSGWIEKIWADETEKAVKKGDKLFQIYSPEIVSAQEELLVALSSGGSGSRLARTARNRLRLLGIPKAHIDRVVRTGNSGLRLIVRSPGAGIILHKNAVKGAKVKAGSDLYRIGNLDTVWVRADIYEFDVPWVRVNQRATMALPYVQGRTWEGKVSFVHSTLDRKSRTLAVRLEFENPGVSLKPGMSATINIDAEGRSDVVRIPRESLIRTGERQIVFISEGEGRFSARQVVTGLVGDDRYTEVITGVHEGDVVVTSGQFLLDSESQLQEAIQKLLSTQ